MDPQQYAWVVLGAGSQVLPAALWVQARPRVAADPTLRPGYRRLIRGFAAWLAVPWVAMGAGCLIGGLPDPAVFLRPAAAGPWAWAFWAAAFGSFGYAAWWAVWGGGAEDLARHPRALPLLPAWPAGGLKGLVAGLMAACALWNVGVLIWQA